VASGCGGRLSHGAHTTPAKRPVPDRPLAALVALSLTFVLAIAAPASGAPRATPAGDGAGALVYPPIAYVPMVRARRALDRAVDFADDGRPRKAIAALKVARTSMAKAWAGARYVVEHAPPAPPADEESVGLASGDGGAGATYAGPEDTAFAVFTLQHEVATTAVEMIDTARGPLLRVLAATVEAAMKARDAAVAYIHARPASPPATDESVDASAAGDAVASTWATVMPQVVPQLDTEIQQIEGTLGARRLAPLGRRVLKAAALRAARTRRTVTTWWPPVPAGDD
jgi:hypothetical protein